MTAETTERKAALRRRILERRGALAEDWIGRSSAHIVARLMAVAEAQSAQTIHCYVSWRKEVDTHFLIKELLRQGKKVVVPVVEKAGRTLTHARIDAFDELLPGAFGILEPQPSHSKVVAIAELDLIIVPGVAFDRNGSRLGFGGGYYDRFLIQCSAPKIGLGYEFQILETIPTENRDQRVDSVISEKNVYRASETAVTDSISKEPRSRP